MEFALRNRRPRCPAADLGPDAADAPHGRRPDPVGNSRYMAERIPGAKLVEFPGEDHLWWFGDQDAIVDEIEEFLTGPRHAREPDRVLATVLFTDIVGSTERAAELGDRPGASCSSATTRSCARELDAHRAARSSRPATASWRRSTGRRAGSAGPGDRRGRPAARARGPRRPAHRRVRGARRRRRRDRRPHRREGRRRKAGPGEVLVSQTVKDLVVGSGIEFDDRGEHELKGVPGEWRLFAVSG